MEQLKCSSGGSAKRFIRAENNCSESKRQRVEENVDKSRFPSINDVLTKMEVGTKMEFIGLVVQMDEEVSKMTRSGKMSPMRKVLLTDNGKDEIFLTIWGPERSVAPIVEKSVLFVKLATLIEFNNEKLLTTPRSMVIVNPSMPEAQRLKNLPIPTTQAVVRDGASVPTTSKNKFFQNRFATHKFVSITDIETKIKVGTKIDFIGLVVKVREQAICAGSKGDSTIREITLMDHTGSEIVAAIYSKEFDDSEILPNFVLFLKTAAVVPWEGTKRLSVIRFNVWVNPTIPEADEIKKLIKTVPVDAERSNVQTENPTTAACKPRYTQIPEILNKTPSGSIIHVLGVVLHRKPLECKIVNGIRCDVLGIVLLDQSEQQISMTISGPPAYLLASINSEHSIVKGLRVSVVNYESSKKLICSSFSSKLQIDPDDEEALKLRQWFESVWCKKNLPNGSTLTTAAVMNRNEHKNLTNSILKREKCEYLPNSVDNDHERKNLPNSVINEDKREDLPNTLCNAKFTPIIDIHVNIPVGSIINVVGAVHVLEPLHIIEYGDGSTSCNRIVTIVDDSRKSIPLRILDARARSIECGAIIAVTNVTVCPKKTLVPSIKDSVCVVNPVFEKARALKEWYKVNAIDKPFVEIVLPITPNGDVFDKFHNGDQTSIVGVLKEKHELIVIKKLDTSTVWRKIELFDHTEVSMAVILWGNEARNFDFAVGSILLITNVRVCVIEQSKFCCCMGLSKIIAHPTETNVVEYFNRLQIWSNIQMLRAFHDRPVRAIFGGVKIDPAVMNATMNNSMEILMSEVSCLPEPIKVEPIECLDSETFNIEDDERKAHSVLHLNEEKKIKIKSQMSTSLDYKINGDEMSCSREETFIIKEEIIVVEDTNDIPYLSFIDST